MAKGKNYIYCVLLKQLEKIHKEGKLNVNDVRILYSHFGFIMERAFELVKNKAVTKISSTSGRHFYNVTDMKEEKIICHLKPKLYCSCDGFLKQVVFEEQSIMCSHLMAIFLGEALDLIILDHLEDIPFAKLIYNSVDRK